MEVKSLKAEAKPDESVQEKGKPSKDLLELEVHVIGEIIGGTNFEFDNAFCTFEFTAGKLWELQGGEGKGQTQVDYPEVCTCCVAVDCVPVKVFTHISPGP